VPACRGTFTADPDRPRRPAPPPEDQPEPRPDAILDRRDEPPERRRYEREEEDRDRRGRAGEAALRVQLLNHREEEDRDRRGRADRERSWEDDDDLYRQDRSERARDRVAGPAIALMVVSLLTVVLALVSLGLHIILGVVLVGMDRPGRRDPDIANFAGGACGALVALVCNATILTGATKMKGLRSYGLAMTASIIALLPCTVCWIGLPFGIWSLVVLNNPAVKDSFR
jgi:hypothetical protein